MRTSTFIPFLLFTSACGSLLRADAPQASVGPDPKSAAVVIPLDPDNSTRTVAYGERDVIPVRARLRFTTLIVLPKREQILDYV